MGKFLHKVAFGLVAAVLCASVFALPVDTASAAGASVESTGGNAETVGLLVDTGSEAPEAVTDVPVRPTMAPARSVAHPGVESDDLELLKLARLGARLAVEVQPEVERRASISEAETGSRGMYGVISQALVGIGILLGFVGGAYFVKRKG